jgi:hypothetical protein
MLDDCRRSPLSEVDNKTLRRSSSVLPTRGCPLHRSRRRLDVSFLYVVPPDETEESGVVKLHLFPEVRMNIHKNARLTPSGRA